MTEAAIDHDPVDEISAEIADGIMERVLQVCHILVPDALRAELTEFMGDSLAKTYAAGYDDGYEDATKEVTKGE